MKILHKLTFLSLSLLVAMPSAFASGEAASPAAGTKGGSKTPKSAPSQSWTWSELIFGKAKPGSAGAAAESATPTNYFWPLVGGAGVTGSIAAYKFVPAVKQKVDAGVKFGKDKVQALHKKLNALLVSLDKPLSQRDVLVLVGGGLLAYNFGGSAINKASEIKTEAGARISGAYTIISESDFVKNYVAKNNYTKAATVAVCIATPILVYKAYQALQARKAAQKVARPVAKPVVQIAQA